MKNNCKLFATYESKNNAIVIKKETKRKQIVNGKAHMIPCQVSIASIPTFERHAPASWWKNLPELEGERVFVEKYLERQEMYNHLFSTKEDSELSVKISKINKYKAILADSSNVVRYYKTFHNMEEVEPMYCQYSKYEHTFESVPFLDFEHTFEGVRTISEYSELSENEAFNWLYGDKLENLSEYSLTKGTNKETCLTINPIDRLTRAIIKTLSKFGSSYNFCKIIKDSGYKDSEYDECIQIVSDKMTNLFRNDRVLVYSNENGQIMILFRKYYQSASRKERETSYYMDLVRELSAYSQKKARLSVKEHYYAYLTDDNTDFIKQSESLAHSMHYTEQFGVSSEFKAEYEDIIKYVHKNRPRILNAFKVWLYCQTHDVMQKKMSELTDISESRITRAGKIWHDELKTGYHARFKKLF